MELRNEFSLPADPDQAYRFLLDLERVAPCIPGGELGSESPDGSYPATITVKLGPMKLRYEGTLRIAERDDDARRAVLAAEAREARGQGSAKARMTMSASGDSDGGVSKVHVVTDVELSGRAAQMGRGLIDDVARRLVAEMASCLESTFAAPAAEPDGAAAPAATTAGKPLAAGGLFFSVLWSRLKRLLAG